MAILKIDNLSDLEKRKMLAWLDYANSPLVLNSLLVVLENYFTCTTNKYAHTKYYAINIGYTHFYVKFTRVMPLHANALTREYADFSFTMYH